MLLVKNALRLIQDAGTVLENADMLVGNDGTVLTIGCNLPLPEGCETLNAAGCAVLPGFTNAHTHLWQQAIMGLRDDLALARWCEEILTPCINALYALPGRESRARAAYLLVQAGVCRMLHSGVTAFLDMDLNYAQDAMHRAASDLHVRGYFGVELADRFLPDENALARDEAEIERLLSAYAGRCVLTPSELNLCSDEALRFIANLAEKTGALIQMHVDETAREAHEAIKERGSESLFVLDAFHLLSSQFSAVHGVHLSDAEIALCRARGVTVVYNPKSNMKLGSGVCPVKKLLDAGVNVALATDGPASNDRLDMFEEMRFGALLQKAHAGDPAALRARDVFAMATAGGAAMLGLNAGTLMPGKLADFSVLPLNKLNLLGGERDIISALVHCAAAGDVRDVFVGGQPALRNYRVPGLDEAALTTDCLELMKLISEDTPCCI